MIELANPQRIHVIGIGGSGMSAIATVLAAIGHQVSGSDLAGGQVTERLAERGITVEIGHDAANVATAELVVRSTAIPDTNVEVIAARDRELTVLSRAEMLAAITGRWRTVAIAGTHGKTTTSAMLASTLVELGASPSFIVGGDVLALSTGAEVGSGEWLVVEADESDATFVQLQTELAVVTNVEPDHLDFYGGFEPLKAAFEEFAEGASGGCIICIDDPGGAELAATVSGRGTPVTTYGTDAAAQFRMVDVASSPHGISFTVETGEHNVGLTLSQPGLYNALNATAALAAAVAMGHDPAAAAVALSRFGGVGRRFEPRGESGGIRFFDDYAHLPTEVTSALGAAASMTPDRLVAVFQPHRYSRTQRLWDTFGDAFEHADVLFVTGIYSANEAPRPGVTGALIVDAVREAHPDADVRYVAELDDLAFELAAELRAGDLCLTLGAGDLTNVPPRIIEHLQARDQ